MDLNIAFTGDVSTTNLDITMNYDETVVDESTLAAVCVKPAELTSWSCSVDTANNQVKAIGFQLGAAAVSSTDPIVVVTLPVLPGAASGDSVNTFTANFFDVAGGDTGSTGTTLTGTCSLTGPDAQISLTGGAFSVAQGSAGAVVAVACDASAQGSYTNTVSCAHNGTYACDYSVDGGDTSASANYLVHCGVRAAESEIDVTPGPGSVLNIVAPMNGTGTATLTFSEILDEGVDATVNSCSLDEGTDFVILTVFPLTVPAGGFVQVQVQGTDPADGSLGATDAMVCRVTDSNGTISGVWDIVLTVQTAAIPTLSTWGLLAMFLTMLSLGGIVIRRKARS